MAVGVCEAECAVSRTILSCKAEKAAGKQGLRVGVGLEGGGEGGMRVLACLCL